MIERLSEFIGDRYRIERELGQGGMARVFLAHDLKLQRPVAIKVLRPEIAETIGRDRFLREIAVAANLNHPNILTLLDSGEAGGLLFYVMPFVEGESLADHLRRETQLTIEDALRTIRQVAAGLHYAHEQGLVHRDIKPDNILLSGDQAILADFGIARAIDSASEVRLTSTGMAVGTPAYMSPEQAAGDATLDARSDIYSLGCVLYEMLMGEPPFGGPTPQAVLARHAVAQVPEMRVIRAGVPEAVELGVMKAMSKVPADRFATAKEFADSLEGLHVTQPHAARPRRNLPVALAAVAGAAMVVAAGVVLLRPSTSTPDIQPLDPDLLAVIPFRVSPTVDSTFQTIGEDILEFLYTRLSGGGSLRAVYPGAALIAWRNVVASGEAMVDVPAETARALGAGKLLVGSISADNGNLVFDASLRALPRGDILARVQTSGPGDSLVALVDELTRDLLVRGAGHDESSLGSLGTAELAALRPYLAGQAAYARGAYEDAARNYERAIAIDSTFALAGLGLAAAEDFLPVGRISEEGLNIAWANKDQLGPRDRAYLIALAGPRFPGDSPFAEQLDAWNDALQQLSDRKEPWYHLGNLLAEWGPALGTPDAHDQARAAFNEALAIDSTFAPALGYVVELAARRGDMSALRRYGPRLANETTADIADYYRWRVATALNNDGELAQLRTRFEDMESTALDRILGMAQIDGVGMVDALPAGEAIRKQSARPFESHFAYLKLRALAMNRGRPAEALDYSRQMLRLRDWSRDGFVHVINAMFWEGDSATAGRFVANREQTLAATLRREGDDLFHPAYFDLCAVNLWRIHQGEISGVQQGIDALRGAVARMAARSGQRGGSRGDLQIGHIPVCASILEAELAVRQHAPNARDVVERLDSFMRSGPQAVSWINVAANLTAARLFEELGDLEAALGAARRRSFQHDRGTIGLSTHLREEGRLAALVGDTTDAIRAYQHYLTLRRDHEPAVADEVGSIQAQLDRMSQRR